MKAYIMLRTRTGVSKEIIDDIRKGHEEEFIDGNTIYGWYDALIELKISYPAKLDEIIEELKRNHLDIVHIGAAIEKTDKYQPPISHTA